MHGDVPGIGTGWIPQMSGYVQWPFCTLADGSLLLVELLPEFAVLFEDGDDHLGEDSSEVGIVGLPSCTQVA